MNDGIKIEWTEPGPEREVRLQARTYFERAHIATRDPTESDLTRALELLAPEVRGRVIGAVKSGGVADHRHLVDVMFGHLPTGTSGMVQGADGWEYPKAGPPGVVKSWDEAHDAAHWKAVAEREASAAAELRGDCRELSAKLAGAVEDRDKARAAMDHWRDRAAAAEKERDEAIADAHLARVVLDDCRRVLTKAENDRDVAMGDRDATNGLQQKARVVLGAGSAENVLVASRRAVAERDEACKERDLAHIAAHEAEQQRDRYRGGHEAAYKKIGQLTEERDAAIAKLEAVRRAAG